MSNHFWHCKNCNYKNKNSLHITYFKCDACDSIFGLDEIVIHFVDEQDIAIKNAVEAIWSDLTSRSWYDLDIDDDIVDEIKKTWGDIILHDLSEQCFVDSSIITNLERAWDDVAQSNEFAKCCAILTALEELGYAIRKTVAEVPIK